MDPRLKRFVFGKICLQKAIAIPPSANFIQWELVQALENQGSGKD